MIIETKGTIKKIYNKQYRGQNKFEIAPILLNVENKDYYLEAIGMYSGIPNQFQEGNPVKCKLEIKSQQDKRDADRYWTNFNLVECELDIDQPIEQPFETIPESKSLDPQEDDLPF